MSLLDAPPAPHPLLQPRACAVPRRLNGERPGMTAQAVGYARACFDEALDWARQRHTFGAALSGRQVIRHKLMDMPRAIDVARCHLYDLAFKRGTKSERICREVKVMMIGGGSEEIMKDLAARQLGV